VLTGLAPVRVHVFDASGVAGHSTQTATILKAQSLIMGFDIHADRTLRADRNRSESVAVRQAHVDLSSARDQHLRLASDFILQLVRFRAEGAMKRDTQQKWDALYVCRSRSNRKDAARCRSPSLSRGSTCSTGKLAGTLSHRTIGHTHADVSATGSSMASEHLIGSDRYPKLQPASLCHSQN
jgi:hypothetical protein